MRKLHYSFNSPCCILRKATQCANICRLQNSPYFSASVGLIAARKESGTSVKITSGIGERKHL